MASLKSSLIVTVKNDASALQSLLADIAAQTVLPNEVILTIVKTSQKSLSVARQWKPAKMNVQIIELEAEATRSQGRNQGVEEATGDILCFTDAGCTLSPSWLEQLLSAFTLPETKLVSGYTAVKSQSPLEEVQGAFTLVPRKNIAQHPLPATRNMAVRRNIFDSIGPFHPELNYAEDYEWSRRAQKKGIQATFVPDAQVWWQPRKNWWQFWRMIFALTTGDMQAHTWRWGHLTMWLRYLALLLAGWIAWSLTGSAWWTGSSIVILWCIYVGIKMMRFQFSSHTSYTLFPGAQILTDSAVLAGTLVGLFRTWKKIKMERRSRYA